MLGFVLDSEVIMVNDTGQMPVLMEIVFQLRNR